MSYTHPDFSTSNSSKLCLSSGVRRSFPCPPRCLIAFVMGEVIFMQTDITQIHITNTRLGYKMITHHTITTTLSSNNTPILCTAHNTRWLQGHNQRSVLQLGRAEPTLSNIGKLTPHSFSNDNEAARLGGVHGVVSRDLNGHKV